MMNLEENMNNSIWRELTPEEIAKNEEISKVELLKCGFLPQNDEYQETSRSSMEVVEQNPRRFIIEECIPACLELWKKNIYTFMVSDHLNDDTWIEVILDNLSEENKEILNNIEGEDIVKCPYHRGALYFGVNYHGLKAQKRLLELAQRFKMQDVPHREAYISLPDFLISCGCYDEVNNPNYVHMEDAWLKSFDSFEERIEYLKKYIEWENSDKAIKTIKVFNKDKMTKDVDAYLVDNGAIYDDERVYLSHYHYQKHLNYINSLNMYQNSDWQM